MTRRLTLTALLVIGAVAIGAGRQELSPAALEATQIEQVKDNLYVIMGSSPANREAFSGGNTGVFVTEEGVTLVDTKLPGWGQVLLDRVRTVTDKPIVRIINTHTHGDHNGSNDFFPTSVHIVAHANTKANMERMEAFQGDGAVYLPGTTYDTRLTIGRGDDRVELHHFGAGHTDGDTFNRVPRAGRAADRRHVSPGGMRRSWTGETEGAGSPSPSTLATLLRTVQNVDTIVPGHIPVTTRDDLEEYQRYTSDLLSAVRTAMVAGQDADQAVASIDLSDDYPSYASSRLEAAIRAIYDELR